jgi:hypothetical protein
MGKRQKDKLIDVLVEMPTLLEEFDVLQLCDDPDKQGFFRRKLIDSCWLCDTQLTEWFSALFPQTEPRPKKPGSSILIDATDLGSAHIMTLYWATCIILYSIMRAVVRPDEQLPERANSKNYCQKIIRTILIFFHPAVGTFRTHLVVFPLSIAMSHLISVFGLEEREVEQQLVDNYFLRPEGVTTGKFLKRLELNTSPDK